MLRLLTILSLALFIAAPTAASAQATTADPVCQPDNKLADRIVAGANTFTKTCLKMTKPTHFPTLDAATQLSASSSGGNAELSAGHTFRWGYRPGSDAYRAKSLRLFAVGRAAVGDEDKNSASIGDLSKLTLESGLGLGIGLELGVQPSVTNATRREAVVKALLAARTACLQTALATPSNDPLNINSGPTLDLRTPATAAAACDGQAFIDYLANSQRNKTNWTAIVAPLWGYAQTAEFFGGLTADVSFPEYKFFPLTDPAMTGTPTIASLPANFPSGATTDKATTYALKAYGGYVLNKNLSIAAALTQRRDFEFVKGTKGVTLCPAAPSTNGCKKVNTAAPYELDGLVIGGKIALRRDTFLKLRSPAVEIGVTHDLETNRTALKVPFYFAADKDGAVNAGVRLDCIVERGRTPAGFELAKGCQGSIFLSSKFKIDAAP